MITQGIFQGLALTSDLLHSFQFTLLKEEKKGRKEGRKDGRKEGRKIKGKGKEIERKRKEKERKGSSFCLIWGPFKEAGSKVDQHGFWFISFPYSVSVHCI